jgi:hypothetical protein
MMILCGAVPVIIQFPAGILSIPLSITTFIVSIIGIMVLKNEGAKVLET